MATVKDVVRVAEVSTSTVSRALHDSSMISEATKRRVRHAMKELDYPSNCSVQNLVSHTTNTIGIILPVRESQNSLGNNPFLMQITQGISSVCSENDYMVSLATGRTDDELQKSIQTLIRSSNITKLIFLYSRKADLVFESVKQGKEVPCAVVGRSYESAPQKAVRFVDSNSDQAGKDVTTFMLAKGYNHLVFAYTDMDELVQTEHYQGYCEALQEYDKKGSTLQLSRLSDEESMVRLQTFLTENPKTEAFVACDDITAIRLQRLFKDSDLENHYATIGFNNSLITETADLALTSVDIFPYGLGENAAKLLLADPKNLTKQTVVIPHKIVERESIPDLG